MSRGRRLPVYLVLDISGSMSGDPIEQVRQGLRAVIDDIRSDPQALETAFLSVIAFSSSAQQLGPLTEVLAFQEPHLDAGGSTNLGHALTVLQSAIDREVVKGSATQKGDWKPLIFLFTDGRPDPGWESAADALKARRATNIIACAAGADADEQLLKRLTETVVKLSNLQPDTLKQFFKWVSSSIKMTSQSLQQPTGGAAITLPQPSTSIQIVP